MRMTQRKGRLTVTVDQELIDAAGHAVAVGSADSLSGWVNVALAERVAKERRLRAMGEAIAAYEAEFGVITEAEMVAQERSDRRAAIVVRGGRRARGSGRKRGAR